MAILPRIAILPALLAPLLAFSPAAQADKRVALVVGIGAYENLSDLANPVGDAGAIAAALRGRGYEVFEHYDLKRGDFLNALEDFQRIASQADVALVYYAGHGMEIAGKNILAPIDTEVSCEPKEARRTVEVEDLFEALGQAKNQVVLLDACRDDPFPQCASRSAAAGSGFRGLQRVGVVDTSLIIANATLSGALAADGDAGGHSPFATALLSRINTDGGAPLRDMLDRTARDVRDATGGVQVPEISTQGGAPDICIDADCSREIAVVPDATSTPPPAAAVEQQDKAAYEAAVAVGSCGALNAFMRAYPSSFYSALAKERADVACAEPEPQHEATLTPSQQSQLEELGIICANCEEPQQQAAVEPQAPGDIGEDGGFLFYDSSERRLSREELAHLSKWELRVARNEIYARNGRFFQSADLTAHFSQFAWYQPHTWEPALNAIESYNVGLIQAEEDRR